MPSPLGHALAGAAAGWALAGPSRGPRERTRREVWRLRAVFGLLGILPDLDLLFGGHRGPTHGLGAVVIVGLATAALARPKRLGMAAAAAYATHILLDWLGTDTSPPIGLMALWPLSREYFESNVHLFGSISRRYWLPGFWEHNLRAIAWELLILLPPALVVFMQRQRLAKDRKGEGEKGRRGT